MINLFFFFEHLCFKDLSKNFLQEYKLSISEDIKLKIVEQLLKKKEPNDIINVKDLAIRRFSHFYPFCNTIKNVVSFV